MHFENAQKPPGSQRFRSRNSKLQHGQQVWQWFPTFRGNDHLGSSQIGFDLDGIVDFQEYYTPFGEVENASSLNDDKVGNSPHTTAVVFFAYFRFTGSKIMPSAYRLQSMQARLQDPVTGRFLSIDPVGFAETGLPGMVNRYSYTYNDPINGIDPDGKSPDFALAQMVKQVNSIEDSQERERAQQQLQKGAGIGLAGHAAGLVCVFGGCQATATMVTLNAPRALPLIGSAGAAGGETVRQIQNQAPKLLEFNGLFHRKGDAGGIIDLMLDSGELLGRAPRGAGTPAAQAFAGPLPSGTTGVEFTTSVIPTNSNMLNFPIQNGFRTDMTTINWFLGTPGVSEVTQNGTDFARIPIEVTKVQR